MQGLSTTVLAVVGVGATACVRSFAAAANVTVVNPAADTEPDARAIEAWRRARASHSPYTMHDADPLQPVADAWAGSFAGEARGGLEVQVAETIARWQADTIGLPDYYLVLEPDDLPAGRRNWYLGVLHRAAPNRVVPVAADHEAVLTAIGRLEAGRWWPDVPELLAGLDRLLPDRVMTAADPGAGDVGTAAEEAPPPSQPSHLPDPRS